MPPAVPFIYLACVVMVGVCAREGAARWVRTRRTNRAIAQVQFEFAALPGRPGLSVAGSAVAPHDRGATTPKENPA